MEIDMDNEDWIWKMNDEYKEGQFKKLNKNSK